MTITRETHQVAANLVDFALADLAHTRDAGDAYAAVSSLANDLYDEGATDLADQVDDIAAAGGDPLPALRDLAAALDAGVL